MGDVCYKNLSFVLKHCCFYALWTSKSLQCRYVMCPMKVDGIVYLSFKGFSKTHTSSLCKKACTLVKSSR